MNTPILPQPPKPPSMEPLEPVHGPIGPGSVVEALLKKPGQVVYELSAGKSAGRVVAEHARAALSDRDRDLFLQLLDNEPAPNRALRKAAKSYRKHLAT